MVEARNIDGDFETSSIPGDVFESWNRLIGAGASQEDSPQNSNSREQEVQDFIKVERFLGEDPRNWSQLESQWIKKAKERSAQSPVPDRVLPPRQEKMMEKLTKQSSGRLGAGVIIIGPPGVGKSEFMDTLADRVRYRGREVLRVNASKLLDNTELVASRTATEVATPSEPKLRMLEAIANNHDPINLEIQITEFMSTLFKDTFRKFPNKEEALEVINANFNDLGVNHIFGNLNDLDSFTSRLADLTEDERGEVLRSLLYAYQKKVARETALGLKNAIAGVLHNAAEKGLVVIIEEGDKIDEILGGFGEGIETILEPIRGENSVVEINGISTTVRDGFLVMVTGNYQERIPWQTRRRFIEARLDPNLADLTFQARCLLSDQNGEMLISEANEHQLTEFMLWWEALGRRQDVSFHSNALVKICNQMKQGNDFETSLNTVLGQFNGVRDQYHRFNRASIGHKKRDLNGNRILPDQMLKLAKLNWEANQRYLSSERTLSDKQEDLDPDSLKARIAMVTTDIEAGLLVQRINGARSYDGGNTGEILRSHPIQDTFIDSKTIDSATGQMSVLVSRNLNEQGKICIIDMPSGNVIDLVISQEQSEGKPAKHVEWNVEGQILGVAIKDDDSINILSIKDGYVSIAQFVRKNKTSIHSNELVPVMAFQQMLVLDHVGPGQVVESVFHNGLNLVNYIEEDRVVRQQVVVHQPNNISNPLYKVDLETLNFFGKHLELKPTALGALLVTQSGERIWVKPG